MIIADALGTLLVLILLPTAFVYGARRGGGAVLLTAVGVHVLIAALSAAGLLLPPESDNLAFHTQAISFLNGTPEPITGPSSTLWTRAISYLYGAFGPSIWLGYAVNQWIFFAALVQLRKFTVEIGGREQQWSAVLIFALLPSSLLFCNLLLREPFQIFALIYCLRQLEKYRRDGHIRAMLKAAVMFVPFGAIHDAFFLFPPIALAGAALARALLGPRHKARRLPFGPTLIAVLAGVAVTAAALYAVATLQENARVSQLLEGDIDLRELLQMARQFGARTVFPWAIGGSPAELVLYAPVLLLQFLCAPLVPFMIAAPVDGIAAVDALLRLVFLVMSYRAYRQSGPDRRRMFLYLFANYLVFCMIAAVGTTTVGTAMRHHLKMFWIPISLGGLALARRRRKNAPQRVTQRFATETK